MRAPKTLDKYVTAEEAALSLEEIAIAIRNNANHRPLIRWSLGLWFWDPRWLDKKYSGKLDHIVTSCSFVSGKKP